MKLTKSVLEFWKRLLVLIKLTLVLLYIHTMSPKSLMMCILIKIIGQVRAMNLKAQKIKNLCQELNLNLKLLLRKRIEVKMSTFGHLRGTINQWKIRGTTTIIALMTKMTGILVITSQNIATQLIAKTISSLNTLKKIGTKRNIKMKSLTKNIIVITTR